MIQERINLEETKIKDLKGLIEDNQKRMADLSLEIEIIRASKKEPKQLNNDFNFLQRMFSKKYKQYLIDKENNANIRKENLQKDAQILNLKEQMDNISKEIDSTNKQIEEQENNKFANLSSIDKVKILLSEDPALAKDGNFIKEIMAINPDFICFDQTDNPNIYIEYLKNEVKDNSKNLEYLESFINELNNPKEAPQGMYKIPHKYLFGGIRSRIGERFLLNNSVDIFGALSTYFSADGKFTTEYAETLEKLYSDENHIFGIHGYGRMMNVATSQKDIDVLKETQKSMFVKGLCAAYSECETPGHNPRLEYTAYCKGDIGFDFLYALTYDYGGCSALTFIQLPLEALDSNKNFPIWGSNHAFTERDRRDIDRPFLLPQYVIGGVIKTPDYKDYKIDFNNEEKVTYQYLYTDGNVGNGGPVNIENQEEIKL